MTTSQFAAFENLCEFKRLCDKWGYDNPVLQDVWGGPIPSAESLWDTIVAGFKKFLNWIIYVFKKIYLIIKETIGDLFSKNMAESASEAQRLLRIRYKLKNLEIDKIKIMCPKCLIDGSMKKILEGQTFQQIINSGYLENLTRIRQMMAVTDAHKLDPVVEQWKKEYLATWGAFARLLGENTTSGRDAGGVTVDNVTQVKKELTDWLTAKEQLTADTMFTMLESYLVLYRKMTDYRSALERFSKAVDRVTGVVEDDLNAVNQIVGFYTDVMNGIRGEQSEPDDIVTKLEESKKLREEKLKKIVEDGKNAVHVATTAALMVSLLENVMERGKKISVGLIKYVTHDMPIENDVKEE